MPTDEVVQDLLINSADPNTGNLSYSRSYRRYGFHRERSCQSAVLSATRYLELGVNIDDLSDCCAKFQKSTQPFTNLQPFSLSESPGVETLLMQRTSWPKASIAKTLAVSL